MIIIIYYEDFYYQFFIKTCLICKKIPGPYSRKVLRTYAYRKSLLDPWLVFQKCSNSSSGVKTGATLRI